MKVRIAIHPGYGAPFMLQWVVMVVGPTMKPSLYFYDFGDDDIVSIETRAMIADQWPWKWFEHCIAAFKEAALGQDDWTETELEESQAHWDSIGREVTRRFGAKNRVPSDTIANFCEYRMRLSPGVPVVTP